MALRLRQYSIAGALAVCAIAASSAACAQSTESAQQYWIDQAQRQDRSVSPNDSGNSGSDALGYAEWTPELGRLPSAARGPLPHVSVKSPQYYDYVPDALTDVNLSELCKVEVAANTAPETTGGPPEPVEMKGAAPIAPPNLTAPNGATPAAQSFEQACAVSPAITLRVLPEVGKALIAYYSAHPAFIWVDRGEVSPKAMAAMAELAASDRFGLAPADYQVALPDAEQSDAQARLTAMLRFELTLSAKALTYVLDARRGRVAPDRISGYHDLPRKNVDLTAALAQMAQAPDIGAYLARQSPDNPQFRALTAALQELKADAQAGQSPAGKIEKLELAMERLRWLPRNLGQRYVFLNEPAFTVSYIDGDKAPLSMEAVIGQVSKQTYFFTDHIKAVEYNPYWNVPRSILVNEMLPHLARDPSYLDRLGYQVMNARGRRVSSAAVNWGAVAYAKTSVDVRQPPGNHNALGRLKIEFPNKHAIYLHDTPEKQLFAHARRAFSHGCVRLQHPREMAAALLDTSIGYIAKQIGKGENASQPVPGEIPVYLAYFTAWPDAQGGVHYYADVYGRDAHLAEALAKTEAARAKG